MSVTQLSPTPMGLSTSQLWAAVESDAAASKQFAGVLAADELLHARVHQRPENRPRLYIANTDPSWLGGSHWIAVYIPRDPNAPVEFFDSLGNRPEHYSTMLTQFLQRHTPASTNGYIYCTRRLQNKRSAMCGMYCLYFAANRCRGVPLSTIVDSVHGDQAVCLFVNNFFNL